MRKVLLHPAFSILIISAVCINALLMYAPSRYHFAALLIWCAIAVSATIKVRRAYSPNGEVMGQGIMIGLILALALSKPASWLLAGGHGSFENVEKAFSAGEDAVSGENCWGSHGPASCE